MPLSRLEELYQRKLAPAELSGKELPLQKILSRDINFYPEAPINFEYDIVEIGPGTGDFLFHLANENPKKKILGIEIGPKRFKKISERLQKREIENVTLIGGDARIPFHKNIPNNTIENCFVLFPDPWPRNKHRHLRLLQKDFLKLICQKLKPNGIFTLATDVEDYARWVLTNFNDVPQMQNQFGAGVLKQELDEIIPTFFAKKWKTMGRQFWYLRFEKSG